VIKHLLYKCKALNSNSNPTKKKKKKEDWGCRSGTEHFSSVHKAPEEKERNGKRREK
jgi:hypothetical protein